MKKLLLALIFSLFSFMEIKPSTDHRKVGLSVTGVGISLVGAAVLYSALKTRPTVVVNQSIMSKFINSGVTTAKALIGTGLVAGGLALAALSDYIVDALDDVTRPTRAQLHKESLKQTAVNFFKK